jgi:hypothetical protein
MLGNRAIAMPDTVRAIADDPRPDGAAIRSDMPSRAPPLENLADRLAH